MDSTGEENSGVGVLEARELLVGLLNEFGRGEQLLLVLGRNMDRERVVGLGVSGLRTELLMIEQEVGLLMKALRGRYMELLRRVEFAERMERGRRDGYIYYESGSAVDGGSWDAGIEIMQGGSVVYGVEGGRVSRFSGADVSLVRGIPIIVRGGLVYCGDHRFSGLGISGVYYVFGAGVLLEFVRQEGGVVLEDGFEYRGERWGFAVGLGEENPSERSKWFRPVFIENVINNKEG